MCVCIIIKCFFICIILILEPCHQIIHIADCYETHLSIKNLLKSKVMITYFFKCVEDLIVISEN